ncbi:hypothetical protein [Microbacterium tenebrionis]|uniref:hypothetical protein n=1 Tax=Microbacterium tenebrionis TaxID=2830665 RepID=UPI00158A3234|nr:hypothetical protein [Microbacterium ihumii]
MDWMVIGTVLAGSAALATVAITITNQVSASVRYDLWVKVLNNARNEHQAKIAADRVDYYFVELAVAELTRKQRARLTVAGFGIVAIGCLAFVIGSVVAQIADGVALWIGWTTVGIGVVSYVVGLAIATIGPDRVRDAQRIKTTEASEAAVLREIRTSPWWQRRRKTT